MNRPPAPATRLAQVQASYNRDARGAWEAAAPHRRKLMRELRRCAAGTSPSLCVLGAGNCNDLSLVGLLAHFDQVHLLDVDGAALRSAVERQDIADSSCLHLHGEIETTGAWRLLSSRPVEEPISEGELDELLAIIAAGSRLPLPGPFDVVASTCLLSQLIDSLVVSVGDRHPRFLELVQAIRRQHCLQLIELTRPGGEGLLVTDFVSTETLPELASTALDDLPRLVERELERRNVFYGLNPFVVMRHFRHDREIAERLSGTSLLRPWLWDQGARTYAVYAIRYRRRR